MESEVNDCEEDVYHRVAMDDEVFKKHVKALDRKYVQTIDDIQFYIYWRISGSDDEIEKKLLYINIDHLVNEILHEMK